MSAWIATLYTIEWANVPKPVTQMTQEEKDAFVDEILDAIDGGHN